MSHSGLFPCFRRHKGRRLSVEIIAIPRIREKLRQERVGPLGSVSEPVSASDRIRFWLAIDRRLREINEKRPGRVSAGDAARLKTKIAERIKPPHTPEERKLFSQVCAARDAIAAFEEREQTARQLSRLARDPLRQKGRASVKA